MSNVETEIMNKTKLILLYIFCENIAVDKRIKILDLLIDKSITNSELGRYIREVKNLSLEYSNGEKIPEYRLISAEDHTYDLSGIEDCNPPDSIGVQKFIDEVTRADRKHYFVKETLSIVQRSSLSCDEMLAKIDTLKSSLHKTAFGYKEPLPMKEVYQKQENKPLGCLTGIKEIDKVMIGLEPGHLMTMAGFVGSFKTMFGVNMAYHNAIELGYNVAVLTLEVPTDYYRALLLSRHSYNPKFSSQGNPINHEDIRKRKLTEEQKDFLFDVVEPDLLYNKEYCKIRIIENHDLPSLSDESIRAFLLTLPERVDLLIVDYIQLAQYDASIPKHSYTSTPADYLVRQLLKLSQNFDGESISTLLLSQTSRTGYANAQKADGQYEISALSEAHELERSSFAIGFLYTDDSLRDSKEVKISLPKNRGGEIISTPFSVKVDPRYCVLGDSSLDFNEDEKDHCFNSLMDTDSSDSDSDPDLFGD